MIKFKKSFLFCASAVILLGTVHHVNAKQGVKEEMRKSRKHRDDESRLSKSSAKSISATSTVGKMAVSLILGVPGVLLLDTKGKSVKRNIVAAMLLTPATILMSWGLLDIFKNAVGIG